MVRKYMLACEILFLMGRICLLYDLSSGKEQSSALDFIEATSRTGKDVVVKCKHSVNRNTMLLRIEIVFVRTI